MSKRLSDDQLRTHFAVRDAAGVAHDYTLGELLTQARYEGRREGAEQERVAVVAELRKRAKHCGGFADSLLSTADDIEAGEHLKGGT